SFTLFFFLWTLRPPRSTLFPYTTLFRSWLLLALLLALLLRNAFPVIRTTGRGMLVEFAGGWLPIRWDTLKSIKVTEDLAAERFRSEEHTSELQSLTNLLCRLLLQKKKHNTNKRRCGAVRMTQRLSEKRW